MGSTCSSRQGKKDEDSASTRSHESPSYQAASKRGDGRGGNNGGPATTAASASGGGGGDAPVRGPAKVINENATANTRPGGGAAAVLEPSATPGPSTRPGVVAAASGTSSATSAAAAAPPAAPEVTLAAPLPPAVQLLPNNLQQLLLGRPAPPAAPRVVQRTRKIVLYVIAADSQDCCVEKGALHRAVYPTLRGGCRERGYELHIVDLHWKSPLEKQQDHEFPELCLGELARQQDTAYVVPVLFLNNSLGTPLLPKSMEQQDFKAALDRAEDKAVLTKWYSFDTHSQPPCYTLRPIASHIPGFKEESSAERERALSEWRAETERALASLVGALPDDLRDTYLTTAVEQEVHNTVFMSRELARRTLWLSRTYLGAPAGGSSGAGAAYPPAVGAEQRRRLETLHRDLRSQLVDKHILKLSVRWAEGGLKTELPEHAQYVADVTSQLNTQLKGIIDAIIDEDQSKTVLKPIHGIGKRLFQELQHQSAFCQQAAQCSVNRDAVLKKIEGYVTSDCRTPLVLLGPRGSGKSTVVARAAQRIATPDGAVATPAPTPTSSTGAAIVVARFVGVSADSATTEQLLSGLAQQAQLLLDGGCCWAPHTIEAYSELVPKLLEEVAAKYGTVVVLIDGLDQVKEYGSTSTSWVPRTLPTGVKFLLTAADGTSASTELKELMADAPESVVQMAALDEAEVGAILGAWVMQYNHSVDKDTVQAAVKDCTSPLCAKAIAWQTSWGQQQTKADLEAQLEGLLKQLEGRLGREQMERCVALLSAAKYGLSDSEMLDVLALDPAFQSTTTYLPWAPASLFWARINRQLAPFLHWVAVGDALVLQWRDVSVREAVRKRYLTAGDGGAAERAARTLCSYFQGGAWSERTPVLAGRLLPQPNRTDKCYNRRKLEELPFVTHRLKGSLKDDFLLDQRWLYDKICGADVYQVLEDLALEMCGSAGASADQDLQLLRRCLQESAAALAYDGRQLFSQLYAQLVAARPAQPPPTAAATAPPPDPRLWVKAETPLARRLLDACLSPPVPQLIPLPRPAAASVDDSEDGQIDLVVRIREYPEYVVTVSTAKEEVAVWDVLRGARVRTLRGLPQPLSLQPVDAHRCVVLCQRELHIYDLDSCTFVTRLKGVMNQKMPYYGMHDANHLVALSRNRMYVNLMNLESGDCVTTFKAGEDRFLNSLLVSGDGRVLVCGDETQKPFPLLVWNLASRKLLYDLRIPHHDFVTSLAAITHEGHYVCCVTKEVDEPSANFIVVYDLQSGTLFKKWKPGVNTVSLEISSRDACVISGLEDGRVLVWDLVTGACRWSLLGHTAPVDFLRLDADGGCFLSADSRARDRSLRLWDLKKGELVAVYTPSQPIINCEVTLNGGAVVLALRGQSRPKTLQLRGAGAGAAIAAAAAAATAEPRRSFGQPDNHGKVVDLRGER